MQSLWTLDTSSGSSFVIVRGGGRAFRQDGGKNAGLLLLAHVMLRHTVSGSVVPALSCVSFGLGTDFYLKHRVGVLRGLPAGGGAGVGGVGEERAVLQVKFLQM